LIPVFPARSHPSPYAAADTEPGKKVGLDSRETITAERAECNEKEVRTEERAKNHIQHYPPLSYSILGLARLWNSLELTHFEGGPG